VLEDHLIAISSYQRHSEGGRGRGGGEEERGRGLDEVCALASRLCELGCRDSGTCSMWGSHDFSAFDVLGVRDRSRAVDAQRRRDSNVL